MRFDGFGSHLDKVAKRSCALICGAVRTTVISARNNLMADASGHSRALGCFLVETSDLSFGA